MFLSFARVMISSSWSLANDSPIELMKSTSGFSASIRSAKAERKGVVSSKWKTSSVCSPFWPIGQKTHLKVQYLEGRTLISKTFLFSGSV